MKQNIFIGLSLALFCIANSYSMEEKEEHFELFQSLPTELKHIIITTILEENITRWDDIFKLDRKSLKEILNNITLVSKDFLVFEKEELKKFIRNLKQNRFTCLKKSIKDFYKDASQEELNKKLTDLLKFGIHQNDLEASVRLIIAGANINTKNDYGQTALMIAAYQGDLEIVRLLIDTDADINIGDIMIGMTALMLAARFGHTEIVKLLIDAGADIDIKNGSGWTALMWAARGGHLEIVKLLIDTGADINMQTHTGKTALMIAANKGHLEIVKLLLNKGADIDVKDQRGLTALMMATRQGHTEIVKLLSWQD